MIQILQLIRFEVQNNKVYSGKASVTNGDLSSHLLFQRISTIHMDLGRLSYYAENGFIDAIGSDTRVIVGGIDPNGI